MTPDKDLAGAQLARKLHRCIQLIKRGIPVVPPDLEVDIYDIIGRFGQAQESVGDIEGSLLSI